MLEDRFRVAVLILDGVLLAALSLAGPQVFPDTGSYLTHSILRPPGYPLLLSAFSLVFREGALTAVVVFQILACLAAASWLSFTLRDRLKLSAGASWMCWGLLISPLLPFPVITGSIGNAILSEAVSYALFLCAAGFVVRHATASRPLDAPAFLLLSAGLTLVRPQFLFLFPAAILLFIHAWVAGDGAKRRLLIGAAILALLLPAGCNRTYQRIVNGRAAAPSLTGIYFITNMLYMTCGTASVATELDPLISEACAALETRRFSARHRSDFNASLVEHLQNNYNPIYWGIVEAGLHARTDPAAGESVRFDAVDTAAKDLGKRLLMREWRSYVRIVSAMILAGMPFYVGWAWVLFLAFAAAGFLRSRDAAAGLAVLFTVMHFSNYFLIALLQPIIFRYSFYTDILQTVAFLALCDRISRLTAAGEQPGAGPADPAPAGRGMR